jgi:hypothetical protein
LKPFLIRSIACALVLALVYLLGACGTAPAGTAAPTPSSLASDTPAAAPTQPLAQPTAAPLAAAALTAAPAPNPTSAPTAAAAPSAAPAPNATAQASAANILISYHKSGGIAGVNETLTVYADGAVEMRNKNSAVRSQAAPGDIQALQKLLVSPEFEQLQLPVQPPVPDQFVYELTVPGRGKPIVVAESADTPPVLRDLIDALEKLKAQAK